MIHRYAVTVAGRKRAVEIEDLGGGHVRVLVDGKERRLDAKLVAPGVWSLLEGTRATSAGVAGAGPNLTVEIDGVVIPVEVADARSAGLAAVAHRTSAGGEGPTIVRSPMPGRVVKVACKRGDRVTAAQPLVVVEAMKMENELRSPRDGTVKDVRVAEGSAVEGGQELVVVG